MADIFLSYARADREAADRVHAQLSARGRSVFVDRLRLRANEPWAPAIRTELHAARCVLVLWSSTSIESSWVRSEADSGLIRGRLIQVLIDTVAPPEPFASVQAIDLVDWSVDPVVGFRTMTEAVDAILRLPASAPDIVAQELDEVVARLDIQTPAKVAGDNVLIATWNVRALSEYTNSWIAGPRDSPKRDLRALAVVAEIIRRFDLVIVQEVREHSGALAYVLSVLGQEWAAITFDARGQFQGDQNEFTTVFYDARRLTPNGTFDRLSAVPGMRSPTALGKLLLHTPYVASFATRTTEEPANFIVVVVRAKYGQSRSPEPIAAFVTWLRKWAEHEVASGVSIMIVGDFGLGRGDDPVYRAFQRGGLGVPDELLTAPRTVFSKGYDDAGSHFVDHIAWMTDDRGAALMSLHYTGKAGYFDFVGAHPGQTKAQLSWIISDHYPLWIELAT